LVFCSKPKTPFLPTCGSDRWKIAKSEKDCLYWEDLVGYSHGEKELVVKELPLWNRKAKDIEDDVVLKDQFYNKIGKDDEYGKM